MIVEKNADEIIIKLPLTIDSSDLEEIIDFIRYKEITSTSEATQKQIADFLQKVKRNRWNANRKRLINK